MIRVELWLMEWILLMDPAREPLCGDLIEQLNQGRSRAWLWRQLLYAITAAAGRRAWADKRATAETWAVGCAMLAVLLFAAYVTALLAILVVHLPWTSLLASK